MFQSATFVGDQDATTVAARHMSETIHASVMKM